MSWNWELPAWPKFTYHPEAIASLDKVFLLKEGSNSAYLKMIGDEEYRRFVVEILSQEGVQSARIEGEILDRESLQSSIKKHFGIHTDSKTKKKESGMAELLFDVYESFASPLTHEMLWRWHAMLFGESDLESHGNYRTHSEPMQIVSNRADSHHVFFEAPPSVRVFEEMTRFIDWFNHPKPSESILGRAAIMHVYFESIHPFEDGNGRIGRALVEKILAQSVGKSVLIAVSRILEKERKEYYLQLEKCNRTLDVPQWVEFFAKAVVQAQEESLRWLSFLIQKSKMLNSLAGQLNPRQEKALLRLFAEGPDGFVGGLSAEKYVAITKASKATATRDLVDLVQKGALYKTGELRHTRYWLRLS